MCIIKINNQIAQSVLSGFNLIITITLSTLLFSEPLVSLTSLLKINKLKVLRLFIVCIDVYWYNIYFHFVYDLNKLAKRLVIQKPMSSYKMYNLKHRVKWLNQYSNQYLNK